MPAAPCYIDDRELSLVLAHELVHFRRRDTFWALLPTAARVLFWFHPLVWLAQREWSLTTESACDQACLRTMHGSPRAYARLLLEIASAAGRPRPLLAVGAFQSRYSIERRLRAMRTFNEWSRQRRLIMACVFAVTCVIALVPWRLAAQAAQSRTQPGARGQTSATAATQPASIEQRIAEMPEAWRKDLQDQINVRAGQPGVTSRERRTIIFDLFAKSRRRAEGQIDCDGVALLSPVVGIIRDVNFSAGDRVRKGDIVCQFDDTKARAKLVEAQARSRLAELELKRADELRARGAQSPTEFEKAAAARDVAEAELDIARQELDQTRIRSPLPGVIDQLSVVPQQPVKVGDYLAGISDIDVLRLDARVPIETRLKIGQDVDVYVFPSNRAFRGRVVYVASHVDGNFVQVRAMLENRDGLLKPGMQGWIDLGWEGQ